VSKVRLFSPGIIDTKENKEKTENKNRIDQEM